MKISFQDQISKEVLNVWELNPSQERFFKSEKKYALFSGGVGCGKSLILILKAIDLSLRYPENYILVGRKTYPELRDSVMKEFFNIVPDSLIKDYAKAEGRVTFPNKSEIIFRHLDTIAEGEIRSLNLGGFFIDQAEQISKEVFMELKNRLRRKSVNPKDLRGYMTCNPALTWLYGEFKQSNNSDYEVIEASTLENAKHLPREYIDDLLKHPESYKKQYVYGIWDEELLSDRAVFAREYIQRLLDLGTSPLKVIEGVEIFKECVKGHRYQIGIDASEGVVGGDETAIMVADLTTEEEVASWSGRVPPDVGAEKAIWIANRYQDKSNRILYVPEMNSIGLALLNRLEKEPETRIFRREEYDKISKKKLEKVGWRTTKQTKALLISRFNELLRLRNPKVYSSKTIAQFKSFVWTDEAKKSGAGAETGFHDDRLISCLLAFFERGPVVPGTVTSRLLAETGVIIKDGKITIPQLVAEREFDNSWLSG